MAGKSVILETVKSMLSAGLSEELVLTTLKDSGISEKEAASYIEQAKSSMPAPAGEKEEAAEEPAEEETETIEEAPEEEQLGEELPPMPKKKEIPKKPESDFQARAHEVEFAHTNTQIALEEHGEKLAKVHDDLKHLHKKIDSFSKPFSDQSLPENVSSISGRMDTIEADLKELKAQGKAIQMLLKKVIESNRELMMKRR